MTALAGPENHERNEIHEGDHAVAAIAQVADEAGDPERRGSEVGADEELTEEEAVGAAFADIALVNVLEEGVGDPIVTGEPDEIGEENEERESDASPEPAGLEKAACGGEDEAGENACDVENDGVFGFEAETQHSADGDPPAGVAGFEEADNEVGGENPPKKIERGVLKFVAFKKLGSGRKGDGKGCDDLGEARAAKFFCHQGRHENHNSKLG